MNAVNHRLSIPAAGAILSLGLLVGASADVAAQPVPPPPEVVVPPPPEVIATVEPVYYEGHPAYWYGGHWYWRDPHGWHWYGVEPAYLRDHRAHAPPPRYHYEHRR
ncbi:MAG TPA: hypothetical protein VEK07_19155 [Polyangiaceae bacterium]|nr:hypothetical protein [Polyangiaceae bacterium]